jgi:voltage-gated potassium channel
MYLVEGERSGFDSIPRGMYWATVTLTTVGYGDIAPVTFWGQFIAACLMIMGYGVIAVPTGIVTFELVQAASGPRRAVACSVCERRGHDLDARYCNACGATLDADAPATDPAPVSAPRPAGERVGRGASAG